MSNLYFIILNNAWQSDYSVIQNSKIDPTAKNSNPVAYQGKLVFGIGQNGYYYFTVADVPYNWQSNQTTWQKVAASLKIDQ